MTAWAANPFSADFGACVCWSPELGLFVAGGQNSESGFVSSDGLSWSDQALYLSFDPTAAVWANTLGLFVLGGAGGGIDTQIITSPDSTVWTPQVTPWDEDSSQKISGLAWSPDLTLLVAVGQDFGPGDTVMTSPDGVNWTVQSTPFDSPSSGARGLAVCWSPDLGLFVCVGDSGNGDEKVMTSPDGVNWTARPSPFDAGLAGSAGACWSARLGLFVVVGTDSNFDGNVVMTSPDGINWTLQTTPYTGTGGGEGNGVAECGTAVVMVGDPGSFGGSATAAILESVDGITWTADTSPFDVATSGEGFAVAYSPELSLAVAVGDDGGGAGSASIATAPFVIPVPPGPEPRRLVGAPWRIIVASTASRTLSDLDHRSTGRQFLYTLNGPAYHTGQVASDDPEINIPFPDPDSPALLTHNRRLLFALRYEMGADPPYVCRFGGIITNFEDQGADAPTSRYTAYDPWQYLMSRPIRGPGTDLALAGEGGITFPAGTRASDIAGFFLEATEAVDGETHIDTSDGSLIEDTDPLTDAITFDAGLSVGEAWQQLVATGTIDIYLPPLYDPIDRPGKVVQFQTAKRLGATRFNIVMAWDKAGRSLQGVNRLVDGTRMANRVKYWAGGTPAPLESDATSIAAYGEWWAQQFFPGEANIGLVDLMALAELQIRKDGARSINLDPAPERTELVLRDYGLGDYLPVWASRNLREPLGIDYDAFDPDFPGASGYHRVFAIPVELDDNGVELTRGIATASEQASV